MDFKDMFELKARIMPALRKRKNDLYNKGYNVSEDDIWEDLKMSKWIKAKDLSLNDIVDDVLKYYPNFK